jgi:hypothetical protein
VATHYPVGIPSRARVMKLFTGSFDSSLHVFCPNYPAFVSTLILFRPNIRNHFEVFAMYYYLKYDGQPVASITSIGRRKTIVHGPFVTPMEFIMNGIRANHFCCR